MPARGRAVVKTGLQIAIPPGTYARVAPRSGLAVKHFIDTGAGVVDEDYRGEVGAGADAGTTGEWRGSCWAGLQAGGRRGVTARGALKGLASCKQAQAASPLFPPAVCLARPACTGGRGAFQPL